MKQYHSTGHRKYIKKYFIFFNLITFVVIPKYSTNILTTNFSFAAKELTRS